MSEYCDVCGKSATTGVVFFEHGREYYYCFDHNRIRKGKWEVQTPWPQRKIWGKWEEVVSHRKLT